MDKPLRVLMAEDSEDDVLLIARELGRGGYDPVFERVDTAEAMKVALSQRSWDIILSDHTMPQFDSLKALQVLRESGLDIPFIIVSGKIGEDVAVAAMKAGASDYIMKDNLARLAPAVARGLRGAKARRERKQAEEALRKSEQRFKELADLLPQTVFETDEKGSLTFSNRHAFETFGYTEDDFARGLSVLQMIAPQDRERAKEGIQRILDGGKAAENEYLLKRKDGSTFFGIVSSSSIAGEKGSVGLRGIITDITTRKESEEALRESEKRFRDLYDNAPLGYHEYDIEGRVTRINRTDLEMLGYAPEEMIGHYIWEFNVEGDHARSEVLAKLTGALPPGRGFERTYRRRDGITFPVLIEDRLILDEKGRIKGIRCTIQDITERKRAEDALKESEEALKAFLNANVDSGLLIDARGTVLVANESLSKRLGKPIDQIIGSCLYHLLPDDLARQRKVHFDEVFRTGKPVCFEDTRMGVDYETFGYPVFDGEGKVIKVAILGFDITQRKKMEQEMANLQEQFRQAQKMEAIGHLAGGIAHDFNNLLTVIQGYSQISLMDLEEDSPFRENIEEIKKAAERAENLTRQLLAFSRRQVLEMKVTDLNSIVTDLDKMLHRVIGEDIELFVLLSEDLGRTKIDRGQMEQVLLNLAVNAKDAMSEGGKLIIETSNIELDEDYADNHVSVKPGHYVMLSVTDTGIGMSPEVMKQVFEPFFTTKERGKGTGLGLSTAYGIVKQSGGNIWVYSEPGKGTTFKIYLPRVEESLDETAEKKAKKELPGGGETLLVVEDEDIVRKLTVRLLRQQGYRVLEARHWEEALTLCKESPDPIHLILTDVVMPEVNGPHLMERLKEVRRDFKVIYMSGYADNAIVKLGILDQGIPFLQKPFTQNSLLHKVREVLDQ